MEPVYKNGSVVAHCPDCGGALTTFEPRDSSKEFGTVIVEGRHNYKGYGFTRTLYRLMRCANCQRGGLAKIHDSGRVVDGSLEEFFPFSIDALPLPDVVPDGVTAEFREAEKCVSFGAWRAASALFRSTLEKTLKANGYTKGTLAAKIDEAGNDGIITDARRKRAQDDVKVLGNDVLHDEWREITPEEVEAAHHYVQRILEDFYDDRPSVEKVLVSKNRL